MTEKTGRKTANLFYGHIRPTITRARKVSVRGDGDASSPSVRCSRHLIFCQREATSMKLNRSGSSKPGCRSPPRPSPGGSLAGSGGGSASAHGLAFGRGQPERLTPASQSSRSSRSLAGRRFGDLSALCRRSLCSWRAFGVEKALWAERAADSCQDPAAPGTTAGEDSKRQGEIVASLGS